MRLWFLSFNLVPLLFKERLGEVLPDHTKLRFSLDVV